MTTTDPANDPVLQQLRALTERLDRLEAIEAIRQLRCRYHDLVNLDAGRQLFELFAPDASVSYGGRPEVHGRDAIRQFFIDFPVQWARQFAHHHVVELLDEPGRARGHCDLDGRPIRDGRSYYVVGRFDDEYRRIDGAWYFQTVRLTVHYMIEPGQGWHDRIPLAAHRP